MEKEFFVNYLNELRHSTVDGLLKIYENPPGRKPREKLKRISEFYKSLKTLEEREKFKEALEDSTYTAIFHFLCILDHVHFIEDSEEKTTFELYASKGGKRVLLNNFDEEPLHDIFNSLVMEEDK